jgi:hypothetical protein
MHAPAAVRPLGLGLCILWGLCRSSLLLLINFVSLSLSIMHAKRVSKAQGDMKTPYPIATIVTAIIGLLNLVFFAILPDFNDRDTACLKGTADCD